MSSTTKTHLQSVIGLRPQAFCNASFTFEYQQVDKQWCHSTNANNFFPEATRSQQLFH